MCVVERKQFRFQAGRADVARVMWPGARCAPCPEVPWGRRKGRKGDAEGAKPQPNWRGFLKKNKEVIMIVKGCRGP